ncbi:MAG: membrane-bound lytic murein transglycosylase D [Saprospiraceae bacterium]|jgi:membrane-bound lytic murein transglycosylase D
MYRLIFLFITLYYASFGQTVNDLPLDSLEHIDQDDWIYPDDPYVSALDSSVQNLFSKQGGFVENLDTIDYSYPLDFIPDVLDKEVRYRMAVLDSITPLTMEYNKYSLRMVKFYLTRRREMLSRVLGLSALYFPIFEAELAKEEMPIELKHLAVVESALLNVVRSKAGAVGLWQFMYNTGVYLGMNIDSYIDERRDPRVSTKYAVKYLKYLHGLYDDWYMALAAYNAGPGNVNKAIRRSGGKRTFWEIYKFLPRETRSYVPAFIAVNYIMSYAKEYNIRPMQPKYRYHEVDTVHVSQAVSFDQISEVLCLPLDELRFLNPQYKLDFIPVNKNFHRSYSLVLPYHLIGEFVINEKVIYTYKPFQLTDDKSSTSALLEKEVTHIVRAGQNIGSIANMHNVSVRDIKLWNKLRGNVIHPKQKLIIKVKGGKPIVKAKSSSQKYLYHVVKKGDSLSEIAAQYKGVSVRSLTRLNGLSKEVTLYPGTNLKLKRMSKK